MSISITTRYSPFLFILFLLSSVSGFKKLDRVNIDDNRARYYLNFDNTGKLPDSNTVTEIESKIHSGDELAVRFFPNYTFEGNIQIGDKPKDSITTRIIFPPQMSDTFSIQAGHGSVVFITNETGKFRLLIQDVEAPVSDLTVAVSTIAKKLIDQPSEKLEQYNAELKKKGFSEGWNVFTINNIPFEQGLKRLELFNISGDSAYLLASSEPVLIGENFTAINLIQIRDYGQQTEYVMKSSQGTAYYETIIPGSNMIPGVQNLNIKTTYSGNSWNVRTGHVNERLLQDGITLTIRQERELPSSIRARAGFAVFGMGTEPRLITNFVMVLFPKEYFSSITKWYQRINPTLGLQIGGTGEKELVFLGGLSIKMINQGDIVIGARFGANNTPLTKPVDFLKQNAYFGATLDPWLFVELKNRLVK